MFRIVNDLKQIDGRYAFARKRVAEKLAQDSSPESVTTLAHAVASSNDQTVIKIAISALSRLRSQESIDALYKVWEKTKHKDLTAILKKRRYVATEINLQVLFALKIGALDILKAQTEDILEILLSAIDDRDTQIASAASTCIAELTNKKTIDLICRKWIEYPSTRLQAIIQQGNYEPNEASIKALFYFLLGEWKKYEYLDFDQSLLAKAYQSASKETQTRVGEKAKIGGRIEWVKILTSNKRGYAVEKITETDWETFIDILESHPDRKEIWKFLYNAPAIWSKKLLDKLVKSSANWLVKDDEIRLNKLFRMAENLREQDFVLFKSSEDRDLDFLVSSESQEIIPRIIRDYDFVQFLDEYTIAGTKNDSRVRREDKEIVLLNLPHGDYLKSITSNSERIYGYEPAYWEISDDGSILVSYFTLADIFDKDEIPFVASLSSLSDAKHLVDITVNIIRHDHLTKNFPKISININQKIIFSSYSNKINFWSLSNGNHLKTITKDSSFPSTMVSSDKYLATAELSLSRASSIKLWSLPDGNLLKTFPDIQVRALTISPDGKFLAAVSVKRIRIWSLPDGNEMKLLEDDTSYVVYSIAISPDAKILVSGSEDLASGSWNGTIRLWSLPDGKHLKTLENPTKYEDEFVYSVAINQNGRALVSNSSDGTMRIWTSPNSPISKLTPRDITEIERKTKDSSLEEGTRNAFKFTLALIRLRQQFDIDIEDSSNNITSSEFDIEIE